MNAMSGTVRRFLVFGPRSRQSLVAALAMGLMLGAVAAPGLAAGSDQPIVASLNPPPAGLNCADAAAATSVYFQFVNPPFQVSQISLYLDGKGAPQDAIDEHWPTVTLSKGLHPGSNTVDIVANGAKGQHIERRMLVQVGGTADGGSGSALVACSDTAVAQAPAVVEGPTIVVEGATTIVDETPPSVVGGDPEPVVVEDTPPVIYETPPTVVYSYPPPVYVYNPYPVVAFDPWIPFVPFFSFGFFFSNYHPYCPPPAVVYNNYYGNAGWHGGPSGGWNGNGNNGNGNGWHGGDGGRPSGGDWHGGPGNGWHGGGPSGGGWHGGPGSGSGVDVSHNPNSPAGGGNPGWHGAPRPSPGTMDTRNNGAAPGWRNQPPVSQTRQSWHGAPQGGMQHFAPQSMRQPSPAMGQYHSAFNQPVQQFRAPQQFQQSFRAAPQQNFHSFQPSAPAFRGGGGGGGGGGGWHGSPAPAFHGGDGGQGSGGNGFRHR